MSIGRGVRQLTMAVSPANVGRLAAVAADVLAAARVERWELRVDPAVQDGGIALAGLELAAVVEA